MKVNEGKKIHEKCLFRRKVERRERAPVVGVSLTPPPAFLSSQNFEVSKFHSKLGVQLKATNTAQVRWAEREVFTWDK